MMKVEIEHAAVIAAYGTTPSSLSDEDSSQLLMTARDGLGDTALASPLGPGPTFTVVGELRTSMTAASAHLGWTLPMGVGGPPRPLDARNWRLQAVVELTRHERMFVCKADGKCAHRG